MFSHLSSPHSLQVPAPQGAVEWWNMAAACRAGVTAALQLNPLHASQVTAVCGRACVQKPSQRFAVSKNQ